MAPNAPPRSGLTRRDLLGGTAAIVALPALRLGDDAHAATTPAGGLSVLRHDAILRPLTRGTEGPPLVGITGERTLFLVRDTAGGAPVAFRPAPG
jgi:hypothetical protein